MTPSDSVTVAGELAGASAGAVAGALAAAAGVLCLTAR
jgi:hypothetical protein